MYNIFHGSGKEENRKKVAHNDNGKKRRKKHPNGGKKTVNRKIYIFSSFGLYFRKHSADFDIFIRLEIVGRFIYDIHAHIHI